MLSIILRKLKQKLNNVMIKVLVNIILWPFVKRRELAQKRLDAINQQKWADIKYETINKGDLMDYDGMGDWGRFPPIKK